MAHAYDILNPDLRLRMANVIMQYEPELMSCDGELNQQQQAEKGAQLSTEWWILVDEALSLHKINVDFQTLKQYLSL